VGLQGVLVAPCSSYPLSSAAERQAHNLEVVGSKPTGGILHFGSFTEATSLLRQTLNTVNHVTGVAQRKRAGLITPRTPDRNGSPVLLHFGSFTEATSLLWQTLNTVNHMARRKLAEADDLEDMQHIYTSAALQKLLVFSGRL
jgi:hypothetical protein